VHFWENRPAREGKLAQGEEAGQEKRRELEIKKSRRVGWGRQWQKVSERVRGGDNLPVKGKLWENVLVRERTSNNFRESTKGTVCGGLPNMSNSSRRGGTRTGSRSEGGLRNPCGFGGDRLKVEQEFAKT